MLCSMLVFLNKETRKKRVKAHLEGDESLVVGRCATLINYTWQVASQMYIPYVVLCPHYTR